MVITGMLVVGAIEKLSRKAFHRIFVHDICQRAEFGHLVATGAADLSEEEKRKVLEALSIFIPKGAKISDEDLDIIAWGITSRSVELR